jgi:hypothetical protein
MGAQIGHLYADRARDCAVTLISDSARNLIGGPGHDCNNGRFEQSMASGPSNLVTRLRRDSRKACPSPLALAPPEHIEFEPQRAIYIPCRWYLPGNTCVFKVQRPFAASPPTRLALSHGVSKRLVTACTDLIIRRGVQVLVDTIVTE